MRHIAVERMQQKQGFVRTGTAHVHMLPEHGELLGQVTVQPRQVLETRSGKNALLEPALERMGAAPGNLDVQPVAARHQCVANVLQLRQKRPVAGVDAGGDLDHALRHFRRDHARKRCTAQKLQQIIGAAGQVKIVGIDQLQLQLDAQRERI